MVFITPENAAIRSFKELVESAKLKETVCGISNSHGEIELKQINSTYGTKFVPVPYKGTGQMIPDIVGGHTPCGYDQIAAYSGLEGKIRFIASSKVVRADIPAMNTVLPKYQFETWYASAIPNNSNLLRNTDIINVIKTWNQDAELTRSLTEKSFILVKSDADLNARAIRETEYYRDQLKK
jgi:tripartite-type tricarboxylate transporter receptor subunit TctC